jgi:intraflagellar transport protein 56
LRGHHQEAVDLYKKMLLESRDMLALNVYVALCYYKLDYYDVSLEILETYLKKYPDSPVALNLKACNHFKLYNGKAAEAELKPLADREGVTLNQLDSDLVRHNLVVFRSGENALQLLPPLLDAVPEAKLNLIIYYLRTGECEEALKLVQSVEPNAPEEYILKGMVLASVGQQTGNKEYLTAAQRNFQLVGSSPSHCDTIPGRQCMAMFFFLVGNFDDVLIYLKSIKAYMQNSLEFTYNYCIVSAACRAKCNLMHKPRLFLTECTDSSRSGALQGCRRPLFIHPKRGN